MKTDVLVVGAGPAGSRISKLLADEGLDILMVDKKRDAGKHACSGLFSNKIKKFVKIPKEILEHKVKGATFHSPNFDFDVRRNATQALVVDRPRFDKFMLDEAKSSGVKVLLGEGFKGLSRSDGSIKAKTSKRIINAKIVIGCDGAGSAVRSSAKLGGTLTFIKGIISYFDVKDDSELVELYYGNKIAPGFFAWKIPRGDKIELGLGTTGNHLNLFKKFVSSHDLNPGKFFAHPILFGEQRSVGDNVMLLGDAAAQVKPFSGGGVVYSMVAAEIAKKAVISCIENKDVSEKALKKSYEIPWKKKLWPNIETGLGIRQTLDSMSDEEFDVFFGAVSEHVEEIKELGDMDFL